MWNKFFKVVLLLPFFLFLIAEIVLEFYIGSYVLWNRVLIHSVFLLGIGIGLSSNKKNMKYFGFILIIIYLIWGIIIGRLDTPKWTSTYLRIFISAYFFVMFAVKNISKYNHKVKLDS